MSEKRVIDIPLANSIDTRTDDKLMSPGGLSDLRNAVFFPADKKLTKRYGHTNLSTTFFDSADNGGVVSGTIDTGRKLMCRNKELLLADDYSLHTYSNPQSFWRRRSYGLNDLRAFVGWETTLEKLVFDPLVVGGVDVHDFAAVGNLGILAYADDSNAIKLVFLDNTTGVLLERNLDLSASNVAVVAVGSSIHVYYLDGGTLYCAPFTPTHTDTWYDEWTGTNVVSNVTSFDVWPFADASVYAVEDSSNDLIVGFVLEDGTEGNGSNGRPAPTTTQAGECEGLYSVCGNSAESSIAVFFAKVTGTNFSYITLDSATLTAGSANTVNSGTQPVVASGHYPTSGTVISIAEYTNQVVIKQGTSAPTTTTLTGFALYSQLFIVDDILYAIVQPDAAYQDIQRKYYLLAAQTSASDDQAFVVGKFLEGTALAEDSANRVIRRPCKIAAGQFQWVLPSQLAPGGTATGTTFSRIEFHNDGPSAYSWATFNDTLFIGGPMVWRYDGAILHEQGFLSYPENVTATPTTGGSLDTNAAYSYKIYYGRYTATGERELSTTAATVDVAAGTMGSNNQIDLVIPSYLYTATATPAPHKIFIYRTEGDGSVYYLVDVIDDDRTSNTQTYNDTTADSSITTNEIDPYASGELDNVSFPSCRGLTAGHDRLWAISNENTRQVVYSKIIDQDEAVEWNEALYITFPERIVGLGFINNQLVAWAEDKVYAVLGQGPNNLGAGGSFSAPAVISRHVGLSDPRSLVETPLGYVFQHRDKLWLLGRDTQIQHIGGPVSDYENQTITSAVNVPYNNHIRLLTSSGRTLVWNYEFNKWTTFTNITGISSVVCDGTYYHVGTDGLVHQEDTSFTDNTTGVAMQLTTGWIKLQSLASWDRFMTLHLIGENQSTHTFTVELAWDYVDTFDTAVTFSSSEWPIVRIPLGRQKATAVKLRIIEVPDGTPGESLTLSAASLEVSLKQGGRKDAYASGS